MEDDVVVIGASISGLLSALVLAESSFAVTLLERDHLPAGARARSGVPQAHHPHVLLARGRAVLDELLPGFGDELVAAGASAFDGGTELAVWGREERARPVTGAPSMIGVTRGLLEDRLRERVLAHPGISVVEGATATGLRPAGPRRIGGVRARVDGGERVLSAALVVDASGRTSKTPSWLSELGHQPPRQVEVDPRQAYASRFCTPPPGWRADWRALLVPPVPGERTSGVLVLPVEDGRWFVGLSGRGEHAPPTDEEGFSAFARDIGVAELDRALDGASPVGSIRGSRATVNRRCYYDRLRTPPAGLVVVGDAVAAFNPVYGQGMTVAALGALALRKEVAAVKGDLASPALPGRVSRAVARAAATPWRMATGADAAFPTTVGARRGPFDHLLTRYADRLQALGDRDDDVRRAQIDVFHLLAPPQSLLTPRLVARTLAPQR